MYKKPSEKVLEAKMRRFRTLKKQISEAEIIAQGADSAFWKAYKSLQKDKLLDIERKLDNFQVLTPEERLTMLVTRQVIKIFISAPDDFSRDMELMKKELDKIKVEIDAYRDRIQAR